MKFTKQDKANIQKAKQLLNTQTLNKDPLEFTLGRKCKPSPALAGSTKSSNFQYIMIVCTMC